MQANPNDKPFVEPRLNIPALIQVTLRLAQILAEEVDLLDEMRIEEIAPLQDEKQRLTAMLEAQKKVLTRKPELLEQMSEEEHEEFVQVTEIFNQVLAQNHRKLRVARDVNEAIVGAIREGINEQNLKGVYSGRGVTQSTSSTPMSVSLNNLV